MSLVSVIIVTYNSNHLIKDCIDSLFEFNDIHRDDLEIIVVDNSETQVCHDLFEFLNKNYLDKVIMVNNEKNLGYGHGNNVGINAATGDIICIMNPDVRLDQPVFLETIKEFNENKKLALLGYKQIGGNDISFYMKPEYQFPFFQLIFTKLVNRINIFIPKFFFLSGAFFFLDKSKFYEIGLFDENIFLYLEEADISNRFISKRYEIKYNNKKSYRHMVGDRVIMSQFTLKNWITSRLYYYYKYNLDEKKYLNFLKLEALFKAILFYLMFKTEQAKYEFSLYKYIERVNDGI